MNSLVWQVQGGGGGVGGGGGTAALYAYKGPAQAIYSIAAKEGWRTLYKGYSTVSQIAPAQALYMATYQTAKKTLPGRRNWLKNFKTAKFPNSSELMGRSNLSRCMMF